MRNQAKIPKSRFDSNTQVCSGWEAVTKAFAALPKPVLRRDDEGEPYRTGWVYRGHKSYTYRLEPSIERAHPFSEWAEMEYRILREFQSKAPMHMDPSRLPQALPGNKLSWLAIMQHYGAPTRLLDFTYSPYVALYFALRRREPGSAPYAEVWGIDATAVQRQADKVCREADREIRRRSGQQPKGGGVSIDIMSPEFYSSSLQRAQQEDDYWDTAVRDALSPCGTRREHFNRHGLVAVALPPVQNVRLSSQQGVFLFNGAESLSFESSLELMMKDVSDQWYKRFRIPEKALTMIEQQLFQTNIHDLSLFPDTEGLAGFVRQKVRLHW